MDRIRCVNKKKTHSQCLSFYFIINSYPKFVGMCRNLAYWLEQMHNSKQIPLRLFSMSLLLILQALSVTLTHSLGKDFASRFPHLMDYKSYQLKALFGGSQEKWLIAITWFGASKRIVHAGQHHNHQFHYCYHYPKYYRYILSSPLWFSASHDSCTKYYKMKWSI